MSKPVTNHLYGMTSKEKSDWLRRLGYLIRKLLNIFDQSQSKYYQSLSQMYKEHYVETGDKAQQTRPKEKDEMNAEGIQSVHDPDAAYRAKGRGTNRQQVSGYSANITETTEGDLRLITDVQVDKATRSDSSYLEPAVKNTVKVSQQAVEQVHTDGGYDSIENRIRFADNIADEWHLAKSMGGKPRYDFEQQENGTIRIYDSNTNKWNEAELSKTGSYRIPASDRSAKYIYFSEQKVKAALALQIVRPKNINKGIRANAESTIKQVFHTLKAGKSKYRGLIRNTIYVTSRSLWRLFKCV